MMLNCIWWWGSSSEYVYFVEYIWLPLLPGQLCPRVVIPVSVPSMGQIDIFENYQYYGWIFEII